MNEQISALHTDKYQLTMMYAHFKNGTHHHQRAFDLYFRKLPFGNGYTVFAGLERAVHYLMNLRFTEEDIEYIKSFDEPFDPAFFDYLRNFRFTGNIYALPEGTLTFPGVPMLRAEGSIIELQLIETALLNFIGFQSLVATKAARIRHVAPDEQLMEFGTRRAQEKDASIWGARAAYLAGFDATSNTLAGKKFGIPTSGTHAHAWIQDFPSELEAFRAYAKAFPDHCVLLVDTYNTLRSGLPHAIQVGKELKKQGKTLKGIRIDSGDLAYLSKQARRMLDEAGLTDTKIVASSDLDEFTILNLKSQGAKVDSWGIGTKLITAYDTPALGAVYKMVSRYENGVWEPTIKISSNPAKVTTPGRKNVYRILDRKNKAHGDLLTLTDERIDENKPLTLFHPVHTFRRKKMKRFKAVPLLKPIFQNGKLVYDLPSLSEIRAYHREQLSQFWEEYLRILNPEEYHVNLSTKLWKTKEEMIQKVYQTIKTEENGHTESSDDSTP
ncbi:nicotinate phosphoribosyltransferase [Thermoactinomyces intermedius]|jgi:nicotinate phosphoribosyltransferase|uniref:Nicotinate phosphoribosyltransferase n=1 Tax=Thermoactinomyces intermedius TaxID=2024 RepID=A0A8I1AAR6_THEIN|nr:nicotinate phosphoribosyltransferase [Thermoactinomyces intermedius]MBA4549163.1 nicotinate phosphoribosyltransferase [Thermoactinomyces intermedius]MBA4837396.1 nicotinate phosphoribosyltransferase [Thermoactinomyces intermedius]MBH8595821.1 nicotinate phosphoribosyltransferase [Thermoactinomyces intermedius]